MGYGLGPADVSLRPALCSGLLTRRTTRQTTTAQRPIRSKPPSKMTLAACGATPGRERYGHLARDAEDQDRGLLDAYDSAESARGHVVGTISDATEDDSAPENGKSPAIARLSKQRAREDSNL